MTTTDLNEVKLCRDCRFYNAALIKPTCAYYQPTGNLKVSRAKCLGQKHRAWNNPDFRLKYLQAEVERTLQTQSDATEAYVRAIDNLNVYMKGKS